MEDFDADCDKRGVFLQKICREVLPFHFTSLITKLIIDFCVHVVICFTLDSSLCLGTKLKLLFSEIFDGAKWLTKILIQIEIENSARSKTNAEED